MDITVFKNKLLEQLSGKSHVSTSISSINLFATKIMHRKKWYRISTATGSSLGTGRHHSCRKIPLASDGVTRDEEEGWENGADGRRLRHCCVCEHLFADCTRSFFKMCEDAIVAEREVGDLLLSEGQGDVEISQTASKVTHMFSNFPKFIAS